MTGYFSGNFFLANSGGKQWPQPSSFNMQIFNVKVEQFFMSLLALCLLFLGGGGVGVCGGTLRLATLVPQSTRAFK